MKFVSTRGLGSPLGIRDALEAGLAGDGGLFVPESFPSFSISDFDGLKSMAEIGTKLLMPFFAEDPVLGPALAGICKETFQFPIPLTEVDGTQDFILELYHGPTSAFKDVGARFLAGCVEVLAKGSRKKRTVIVATSGDTGGAVAGAFHRREGVNVVILYPKGRISPRQEAQLCAWGDNIRAFAVEGTFDDCQRMVKEVLVQNAHGANLPLGAASSQVFLSANSINLGRILPQMIYYAEAALQLSKKGRGVSPSFIIPTGNLGNSVAALWAKRMGLPIGHVYLSLNANSAVADYLATGKVAAHSTIATLANAMDVGNPSNLERLQAMYLSFDALRADVSAECVSDEEICEAIRESEASCGQVVCPHTATALVLRERLRERGIGSDQDFVMVSTAHPAKFETIVEPLVGNAVEIPATLAKILKQPFQVRTIAATVESLMKEIK